MELQVIRTIHPIGQGAFYTETLHRPGSIDDKHIVCDCGSKSSLNNLEKEIDNYFLKDTVIDVLFISHFHEDHVNGIKHLAERCKIHNVVVPQIDGYEWFYIIENYLTTGNADVNVVSDVRALIGEGHLIQVTPAGEDNERAVSEEFISLDENEGMLINGYSPLIIGGQNYALWHYIVVNPLQNGDLDKLKTEIEDIDYDGRKLSIGDLNNPEILVAVRNKLQAAYIKIFKGGNEYSMCVLSELADRENNVSHSYFNRRCWCDCHRPCHYERYCDDLCRHDLDGALYCGDVDFLYCNTLNILMTRLRGREMHVGLLQLPHHGSRKNFNVDLFHWLGRLLVSFACYGSPNSYNHPSSYVMGTANTYCHVVGIDQYASVPLSERVDVI